MWVPACSNLYAAGLARLRPFRKLYGLAIVLTL
jgi:hypothetical protein